MPPARRMEQCALERLDSLQLRELGYKKHSDCRYKGCCASYLRCAGAHVACFNAPHFCIRIPLSFVQRRVEPTMSAKAVLVRYFMYIVQNFGLGTVAILPIRFEVRGERVKVDVDIGGTAL